MEANNHTACPTYYRTPAYNFMVNCTLISSPTPNTRNADYYFIKIVIIYVVDT